MRLNHTIWLAALVSALFVSCAGDSPYAPVPDTPGEADGGLLIDIAVDGFDGRTRAVSFGDDLVRINSLWLGVFDRATGACVDRYATLQNYIELRPGDKAKGAIRVRLNLPEGGGTEFFIVAVANYAGSNDGSDSEDGTGSGKPTTEPVKDERGGSLSDRLDAVTSWDDFKDICVDAATAYSGTHGNTTPVMAGFLKQEENESATHVKIDQFAAGSDQVLNLYPKDLSEKLSVPYKDGKYDTSEMTLFLRRLVANVNVNIAAGEGMQIMDVAYKRYNMPKAVYLIERRTVDDNKEFPIVAELSPNYGDRNLAAGYENDADWIEATGNQSFSFQHFANKHWARKTDMTVYRDREERTEGSGGKFYFNALADNADDFNNYASYFVIKMHVLDKENRRCANAEYTIHEGNTSDENGDAKKGGNLMDFVCARNINYTYKIKVSGIENIYLNAGASAPSEHFPDQGGKIWQMNYANDKPKVRYDNGTFEHAIGAEGGLFENVIQINSSRPDLAFRLYGYNSQTGVIEGYNYNFTQESFKYLDGMWPPSVGDQSHYYQDYNALIEDYAKGDKSSIETLLFETFHIIDADDPGQKEMNLVEFIKSVHELATDSSTPIVKKYHLKVARRQIEGVPAAEKDQYIRALYIADRNGQQDRDGCTTLINIFSAVQDPPIAGR